MIEKRYIVHDYPEWHIDEVTGKRTSKQVKCDRSHSSLKYSTIIPLDRWDKIAKTPEEAKTQAIITAKQRIQSAKDAVSMRERELVQLEKRLPSLKVRTERQLP